MSSAEAFDEASATYDEWYEQHPGALMSELKALEALVPRRGLGLDLGVGTGLMAERLGVQVGLDPSAGMLRRAAQRGIMAVRGGGEALPFRKACFDYAVSTAALCFMDEPAKALEEAWRVVKPGGRLVACIISRDSQWGRLYEAKRRKGGVYTYMKLLSPSDLESLMRRAGFKPSRASATLSQPPGLDVVEEPSSEVEGRGFVCLEGLKEK